jgi:hypothetical protein
MSGGLSERTASSVTGGIGLAFSLAYIAKARGIEDSLLADEVGASGVPVAIGCLMAATSAVLLVKALLSARAIQQPAPETDAPAGMRPHLLAFGLMALLTVYMVLLPWLGYVVAIGLLAAAVAWFAGGRERKALLGFALLTGPFLWFLFDFALKVRMPAGFWPTLFSG